MRKNTYDKLFSINFEKFRELVNSQNIYIDEKQLLLIYNLIQNNRYALIDSHYNEVLFNYISEKTSISTCLKIKSFIIDLPNYFRFGLNI